MVLKRLIPFLLFFTRRVSLNQLAKTVTRGENIGPETNKLNIFKTAGLGEISLKILKEQNKDIFEPLAINFENL